MSLKAIRVFFVFTRSNLDNLIHDTLQGISLTAIPYAALHRIDDCLQLIESGNHLSKTSLHFTAVNRVEG